MRSARSGLSPTLEAADEAETGSLVTIPLYSPNVRDAMSGKAKFVLALAMLTLVYVLVSSGAEPVEVEVEA